MVMPQHSSSDIDAMVPNASEAYDFLVSVVRNAPLGILTYTKDGKISMCNQLASMHLRLNHSPRALIERPLTDFIAHLPALRSIIAESTTKSRQAFSIPELSFENGTYIAVKGRKLTNGMIITTHDITPMKSLQRSNVAAMLKGQEKERHRLAKEIHDGIGPLMSTIKLNLDSIKNDLHDDIQQNTMLKFNAIQDLIKDVSEDIRSISHALMPSALNDFGLRSTLENLIQKINQSETVKASFYFSGSEDRLYIHTEIALYRMAQELINNALKYANAKQIVVQLIRFEHKVLLTVEDDGIGCSQHNLDVLMTVGIGLQNIYTRTEALKGSFVIDSSEGNGFSGTIEIPTE